MGRYTYLQPPPTGPARTAVPAVNPQKAAIAAKLGRYSYLQPPPSAPAAPEKSTLDVVSDVLRPVGDAISMPFRGLGMLATLGQETIAGIPDSQSRIRMAKSESGVLDKLLATDVTAPDPAALALEGYKDIGELAAEGEPLARAAAAASSPFVAAALEPGNAPPAYRGVERGSGYEIPGLDLPATRQERKAYEAAHPVASRVSAVAEPLAHAGLQFVTDPALGLGKFPRALSAAIAPGMAVGTLQSGREFVRAGEEEGYASPEAIRAGVGTATEALLAALTAGHAIHGEPTAARPAAPAEAPAAAEPAARVAPDVWEGVPPAGFEPVAEPRSTWEPPVQHFRPTVQERFRPAMEDQIDRLVAELSGGRPVDTRETFRETNRETNDVSRIRNSTEVVLPLQDTSEAVTGKSMVPGMQGGMDAPASAEAPRPVANGAPEGERQIVRERVPTARQDQAGAVFRMRGGEGAEAPSGLREAAGSDLAVPTVPSGRTQSDVRAVVADANARGESPRKALVDRLGLSPSQATRALREIEAAPTEHKFSSTQVELPPDSAAAVRKMADKIPDADLAKDGREARPHVTVKYGLHTDNVNAVRQALENEPPITVKLGKTSTFDAKEGTDYDVVKADVDSPDLHRLNAKIRDAVPTTDTQPEYVPHATVAYVKAGLGKKYAGDASAEGHTATIDRVTFSDRNGKTHEIQLKGVRVEEATAQTSAAPAAPQPPPAEASVRGVDLEGRGDAAPVGGSEHEQAVTATLQQMEQALRTAPAAGRTLIRGNGGRVEGGIGQPSVKGELGLDHLKDGPEKIAAAIRKDAGNPIYLEAKAAAEKTDPFGFVADAEERAGMRDEPLERRSDDRRVAAEPVLEDRRRVERRDAVAREVGLEAAHPAVEKILAAEDATAAKDVDELTGVLNRDAYQRATKAERPPAVSEVDVAGAGATNAKYGEPYTDAILAATGRAMKAAVGDSGTVYRKGGDEFVVHWNDHEVGARMHAEIPRALRDAVISVDRDGQPVAQWRGVDHYDGFGKQFEEASAAVYAKKPRAGEPGYKALPATLGERVEAGRVFRDRPSPGRAGVRGSEGPARSAGREPVAEPLQPTGTEPRYSTQKAPVFFSQLERVATDKKAPGAASGNDWSRYLSDPKRSVKADEMKWTGLDDFLKERGTKKVTKQEIADFLRQNAVEVKEVVAGDVHADRAEWGVRVRGGPSGYRYDVTDSDGTTQRSFDNRADAESFLDEIPAERAKFSRYTLPGGENYRELLLTLPSKATSTPSAGYIRARFFTTDGTSSVQHATRPQIDAALNRGVRVEELGPVVNHDRSGDFQSGHFDEPNILAHVRLNERIDSEGKRVLFVEEVQSDWAQKGRREGFAKPERKAGETEFSVVDNGDGVFRVARDGVVPDGQRPIADRAEADQLVRDLNADASRRPRNREGVPAGPFVGSTEKWSELAMKRVVRYAAENGFDRVAWTTGEQQAARYDLSKQIDSLKVTPILDQNGEAFQVEAFKGGDRVVDKTARTGAELAETIGKDLADRAIQETGGKRPVEYSGLDLKVGGEGMKGYYDKILPSVAGKIGKKWGAKVGETFIKGDNAPDDVVARTEARYGADHPLVQKNRLAVHSMDITPEMRRSVTEEGQPLFRADKAAGSAAEIGLPHVKRAFGSRPVTALEDGAFEVSLPGRKIRIQTDGSIELEPAAFSKGYGRAAEEGERAVGAYQRIGRDALIRLAKEGGTERTLDHETFHAAMDLALSPKEKAAVLKRYGSEESAAEAYADWKPSKPEGMFQKIAAFFQRIWRAFRPRPEVEDGEIFGAVRSGEAFGRRVIRPIPPRPAEAFAARRPPAGQRGLPGIGDDVAPAGPAKKAPAQGRMFSEAEMLQPSEARVTEGREADGPLFTQENDAAVRAEEGRQTELPKYATTTTAPPKPPPLGRPMKPEEAPRVEEKAVGVRRADPEAKLSRETERSWESLDPEIRKRLGKIQADPMEEARLYNRAKQGKVDDVDTQVLDALVRSKRETYDETRQKLQKAQEEGRETGPENVEYLKAAFDQVAAEYAKAARTDIEAGTKLARALAARARVMEAAQKSTPDQFLKKVLREIPGVNDKQAGELVRIFQERPRDLQDALHAAIQPGKVDKFLEVWKAGLVSGLPTQGANVLGNIGNQVLHLGETAVSAGVDKLIGGPKTRLGGEARYELGGAMKGAQKSIGRLRTDLLDVLKLAPEKIDLNAPIERQVGAVGGKKGRAIRAPFRILSAFDDFFKGIGSEAELHKLAFRRAGGDATKAAVTIGEWDKYQRGEDHALPSDLLQAVNDATLKRVFQDPNEGAKAINRLRTQYKWLHAIMPFTQTPANIARVTLERSPAGFVKAYRAFRDFKAAERAGAAPEEIARLKGEASDAIARPLMGTMLMATFAAYAKAGGMTGSGPADPKEKGALLQTGWQPYSFRLPGGADGQEIFVPYNRFEPVSALLGFAADLAEAQDSKTGNDLLAKGIGSVVQNLTSKTYLQGIADAAAVIRDPMQFGSEYASNMGGTLVPNIIAKAAQAVDSKIRDTRPGQSGLLGAGERVVKTIESRIPGLSMRLPERRSGTGAPMERQGNALFRFASPVNPTRSDAADMRFAQLLVDLEAVPSAPRKDVTVRGRKVQLSDEEYEAIQKADERTTRELRRIVASVGFRHLSEDEQKKRIDAAYNRGRSQARSRLLASTVFMARARRLQPRSASATL